MNIWLELMKNCWNNNKKVRLLILELNNLDINERYIIIDLKMNCK